MTFGTRNHSLEIFFAGFSETCLFPDCLSGQNFLVTFRILALFLTFTVCVDQDTIPFYLSLVCYSFMALQFIYLLFKLPPGYIQVFLNCACPKLNFSFFAALLLLIFLIRGWHHVVPNLKLFCSPHLVFMLSGKEIIWKKLFFKISVCHYLCKKHHLLEERKVQ